MLRMWVCWFAVLALAWARPGMAADPNNLGKLPPGQFDFYVLSLTWVPGFCAGHSDPAECSRDEGFRLHGLWPESAAGYPFGCSDAALPTGVRARYAGLFPSPGMIDHEWRAHGTCSGLGPAGFFAPPQRIVNGVVVPPGLRHRAVLLGTDVGSVKAAFLAVNPGLTAGSLVVVCARRRVEELHVCLGKDGGARMCDRWEGAEERCR
ncbi:MAG: ribonuclease T [Acetobacteraceae bacterium]|nr:ribonuclease T [Acetobacteraceae bacterium]